MVVIGGGIAGLVTALDLAGPGSGRSCWRPSSAVGGVLSAHRVGGLTLDAGAESFATARPAVTELLAELGLADRIVAAEPGRAPGSGTGRAARRCRRPGCSAFPGHPLAADVRRVIGLPGVVRALADTALPARAAPAAGTTLGALVRSRMGPRVLDRLVEPVAGGVYATDPDLLELDTVPRASDRPWSRRVRWPAPRGCSAVAASDPVPRSRRLSGGLHTLVDPLIAAVLAAGGTVRTGATVAGLARTRIGLAGGAGRRVRRSRRLRWCWRFRRRRRPGCWQWRSPTLSTVALHAPIAPVLICTLVIDDARLDRAPRGTGVLVSAHATGVRAKALTHATAKWPWLAQLAGPGRHVLRLSYGRGEEQSCKPTSPSRRGRRAGRCRPNCCGVALSPASAVVDAAVVRWGLGFARAAAGAPRRRCARSRRSRSTRAVGGGRLRRR